MGGSKAYNFVSLRMYNLLFYPHDIQKANILGQPAIGEYGPADGFKSTSADLPRETQITASREVDFTQIWGEGLDPNFTRLHSEEGIPVPPIGRQRNAALFGGHGLRLTFGIFGSSCSCQLRR